MRWGTCCPVTTAWPRAASVGERMKAIRISVQAFSSGKSGMDHRSQSMVRGSPMPSNRMGSDRSNFNFSRSMVEASINSTRINVNSARTFTNPALGPSFRISIGKKLTSKPTKTKTMGAVIMDCSARFEMMLYPKISTAMKKNRMINHLVCRCSLIKVQFIFCLNNIVRADKFTLQFISRRLQGKTYFKAMLII